MQAMNLTLNSTETKTSFSSKGVFPHKWAFTLLIPLRNLILSPKKLINRMALLPDMHVLEVGPGPGYFSLPVAKKLTNGKLVLADIQPEMIEMARMRLESKGLTNLEYYICSGESFDFPDNSFDRIFLVTVLGEVEKRDTYLEEFKRMLKPNGILSISEQAGDPDKLTFIEVREMAERIGFKFLNIFGSVRNYTINFSKRLN
jgi:ubiquinone/menaquinone biosynthesis C-methylase UbiE